MTTVARDFERREFSPRELAAIKATRRRSPRLHEAEAVTQTFQVSASLMDRIRERASSEGTTESQVIRDAVDPVPADRHHGPQWRHHREPGDPPNSTITVSEDRVPQWRHHREPGDPRRGRRLPVAALKQCRARFAGSPEFFAANRDGRSTSISRRCRPILAALPVATSHSGVEWPYRRFRPRGRSLG